MPYNKFALKYAKRSSAARRIQRKYRSYRSNKFARTTVKRVMYKMEPFRYAAFATSLSIPNAWTLMNNITNISYDPNATTSSADRQTTKILVKNYSIRGKLTPGTADVTNVIRISLIRGRRSGALSMTDIQYGVGTAVNSQFNQKFVEVIWDKTYQIQETVAGAVFPPYKFLDISTQINKTCKFEESTAAETKQPYNNTSYYLIACSDSVLTPHPRLQTSSRVSFKELD